MLQVFLFQFDSFPTLFFVVFVIVLIIIFLSALTSFLRIFRRPRETESTEEAAVVKEKEIIREIVKIRCPYCNNLYDEKYDKCPHCGGTRRP